MAEAEHLDLLKHGVKVWNEWRQQNVWVKANFSRANLSQADLSGANLSGAHLRWADLSGAFLCETVFGDTTLRDVRGLDACRHLGPSTIDHRTLAKSSAPLPLPFLRGCGLPDQFIEY